MSAAEEGDALRVMLARRVAELEAALSAIERLAEDDRMDSIVALHDIAKIAKSKGAK